MTFVNDADGAEAAGTVGSRH